MVGLAGNRLRATAWPRLNVPLIFISKRIHQIVLVRNFLHLFLSCGIAQAMHIYILSLRLTERLATIYLSSRLRSMIKQLETALLPS